MAATASPISPYKRLRDVVINAYFGLTPLTSSDEFNQTFRCPACHKTTLRSDLEIQTIIPWGSGADGESWNCLPLCTRAPSHNNEDEDWGCSEQLERSGEHTIDWMLANHPYQLHEMCVQLQLAHGESFGLPASEVVCLRFLDKVYRRGCRRRRIYRYPKYSNLAATKEDTSFSSNPTARASCDDASYLDPLTRDDEWIRKQVGFHSDILDLAQCFADETDRAVAHRIEDLRVQYFELSLDINSSTTTTTTTDEGCNSPPPMSPRSVTLKYHRHAGMADSYTYESSSARHLDYHVTSPGKQTTPRSKQQTKQRAPICQQQRIVALYDEALDSARRALETPPKPR